jgi:hypothetical protein
MIGYVDKLIKKTLRSAWHKFQAKLGAEIVKLAKKIITISILSIIYFYKLFMTIGMEPGEALVIILILVIIVLFKQDD